MSDDLKDYYDYAYSVGKSTHFLKYRGGRELSEEHVWVRDWIDKEYSGSRQQMLDFGCGEANFLRVMTRFECRIGIDFSERALAKAREGGEGLDLRLGTEEILELFYGQMDIVTSFGTLEHTNDPEATFRRLFQCVRWNAGGTLILSCPSFLNARGVIWMTLALLFNVPMSLSDRHYLSPAVFTSWLRGSGRSLELHSVDHDVTEGDYFAVDMTKRLNNALRDAGMDNSKVDQLISWVNENRQWFPCSDLSGANMIYIIR